MYGSSFTSRDDIFFVDADETALNKDLQDAQNIFVRRGLLIVTPGRTEPPSPYT